MFGGSFTLNVLRSSIVHLQCSCNFHTASIILYPRALPGKRTTPIRSTSPPLRPGRTSSAPLQNNNGRRSLPLSPHSSSHGREVHQPYAPRGESYAPRGKSYAPRGESYAPQGESHTPRRKSVTGKDSRYGSLHNSRESSNSYSNRSTLLRPSDDRRTRFLLKRSIPPRSSSEDGSDMPSHNYEDKRSKTSSRYSHNESMRGQSSKYGTVKRSIGVSNHYANQSKLSRLNDGYGFGFPAGRNIAPRSPSEDGSVMPRHRHPESRSNEAQRYLRGDVPGNASRSTGWTRYKKDAFPKSFSSPNSESQGRSNGFEKRSRERISEEFAEARKQRRREDYVIQREPIPIETEQTGDSGKYAKPDIRTSSIRQEGRSSTKDTLVSRTTPITDYGAGRSSFKSQQREQNYYSSQKWSGETAFDSSSGVAREKALNRSLNSRMPYTSRGTRKTGNLDPVNTDRRASSPTIEPSASYPRSSQFDKAPTSTKQQYSGGRDSGDFRAKPTNSSALDQPISRADRREQNVRKRRDLKVKLLERNPNKLGKEAKNDAEKWRSRHAETPKAQIEEPSHAPITEAISPPVTPAQHDLELATQLDLQLTNQSFASYSSITPPTSAQLDFADRYFMKGKADFLFSCEKFRDLPLSSVPEVVFLGRSNVGKSSLLNALVKRTTTTLANVSSKPGRTRTMNAFGVGGENGVGWARTSGGALSNAEAEEEKPRDMWIGKGGLVVLDVPGYGKSSRDMWGKEVQKYLFKRQQLRRAFVLINSVHGLKNTDHQLLSILREQSVPHQLVLTKIDAILLLHKKVHNLTAGYLASKANHLLPDLCAKILKEVRQKEDQEGRGGVKVLGDVICCSSTRRVPLTVDKLVGIDGLRFAVLSACGLESDAHGNKKVMETGVVLDDMQGVVAAM